MVAAVVTAIVAVAGLAVLLLLLLCLLCCCVCCWCCWWCCCCCCCCCSKEMYVCVLPGVAAAAKTGRRLRVDMGAEQRVRMACCSVVSAACCGSVVEDDYCHLCRPTPGFRSVPESLTPDALYSGGVTRQGREEPSYQYRVWDAVASSDMIRVWLTLLVRGRLPVYHGCKRSRLRLRSSGVIPKLACVSEREPFRFGPGSRIYSSCAALIPILWGDYVVWLRASEVDEDVP